MTSPRALQTTPSKQALLLSLAALVTLGGLAGVAGEASSDRATELAQHLRAVPQATVTTLRTPQVGYRDLPGPGFAG